MNATFEHSAAVSVQRSLPLDQRLSLQLMWLAQLIQENGSGEYIVTIKQDGGITVKRPRRPLEFHYAG